MRGVPGVDRGLVVDGVVGGLLAAGGEKKRGGDDGGGAHCLVKRGGHHGQKVPRLLEMQGRWRALMRGFEASEATFLGRRVEKSEDVGGGEAVGAEGAEGEGVVALGEADAVGCRA